MHRPARASAGDAVRAGYPDLLRSLLLARQSSLSRRMVGADQMALVFALQP